MGQSYSTDLRRRVVEFVGQGHSRREAANHFSVSASFAVKLLALHAQSGSVAPRRQGRPPGQGKLLAHRDYLTRQVDAKPDMTMPELAAKLAAERGVRARPSSLSRILTRAGFTFKKKR